MKVRTLINRLLNYDMDVDVDLVILEIMKKDFHVL
jgi:hypothetical protein